MDKATSRLTLSISTLNQELGNVNISSPSIELVEGDLQTIGTSPIELLTVPGPSAVFIKHMGEFTDGNIIVDSVVTMDCFPQILTPGTCIYLAPEFGTIYIKADTSPCKVWAISTTEA